MLRNFLTSRRPIVDVRNSLDHQIVNVRNVKLLMKLIKKIV